MKTSFMDSPITRAEMAYQRRATGKRRWFVRLMFLPMVAVAMVIFGGELTAALLQRDTTALLDRLGILVTLLQAFTLVAHFALMARTLLYAYESIARERRSNQWEGLLLTGMSARQILLGKWWATVRCGLSGYLVLALLRIGVMTVLGIRLVYPPPHQLAFINGPVMPSIYPRFPAAMEDTLIAGVILLSFTLVNLPFTAAFGIIGALLSRREPVGVALGFVLRTAIMGTPALVVVIVNNILAGYYGSFLDAFFAVGAIAETLLLNGLTQGQYLIGASSYRNLMYWLSDYYHVSLDTLGYSGRNDLSGYLIYFLICIGVYLLLTAFALRIAQALAVRQGALRPTQKPKQRTISKRKVA